MTESSSSSPPPLSPELPNNPIDSPPSVQPEPQGNPRKSRKRVITVVLVIVLLLFAIGVLATIYDIVIGVSSISSGKSPAFAVCNSLEAETSKANQQIFKNKHVDGKYYNCGGHNADLRALTSITYTLRGEYDKSQTANNLTKQISMDLQSGGWISKTVTPSGDSAYDYALGNGKLIVARYKVINPKYNIFELQIRVLEGYQIPEGAKSDSSRPKNITLPSDELEKYPSFTLLKPTYVPAGFSSWKQGQYSQSVDDGSVSVTFSGTNSSGSTIWIREELSESGNAQSEFCGQPCKPIYVSPSGVAIYSGGTDTSDPTRYIGLGTVIGDTKVSFTFPAGKTPTTDEAIKVLSTLQN